MHITISTVRSVLLIIPFSLAASVMQAQNQSGTPQGTGSNAGAASAARARAMQNAVTVSGVLTDASTGRPLSGINVRYLDLSAAITDSVGGFSLKVPDYSVTIIVESEGYQTKEIALKGRKTVATSMYEGTFTSFYDMATLPSGDKPLNQVPYAVTSVQTQGAWDRSFETPDAYLQGKVPGLNTIRRSGTPNAGANLFLRGYNSLYATNQPLIVVDGIIYDNSDYGNSLITNHYNNPLGFIDVRDIDNITVMKDGSSLYGTKGGNGVIMITTARAKELATRIDFAAYSGFNVMPAKIPVLNAADYRVYVSQLLQTRDLTDAQIKAFPFMNDDPGNPEYYRYHYNTDWQKQVLNNSMARNIYLKITGGDNIAKYALSLGYMKSEGVTKATDLSRYNTRFNADLNLSKRMTATTNLSFSFNEQDLRDQGIAPKTNPIYLGLVKAPILPVHVVSNTGVESPDLAESDTFNVSNPVTVISNNVVGLNKNYRFSGSMGFNYNLSAPFSLGTTVAVTIDKTRESFFYPKKGIVNDTLNNAIVDNRSGSQVKRLFMLFNDTHLSFNKTFNRIHTVNASAGFRFIQSRSEQDYGLGYNSATDELVSVGNGIAALRIVNGNIGDYRWLNNYLSANYNLSQKYFLSLNMAVDGSSRFGKEVTGGALKIGGNSFAVLPSVAGAWLVSSENFMAGSSVIELLKLRASFGVSGNDDIGNFTSRQTYVSQNFLGIQGLVRGGFGNTAFQWESVQKINGGLDLSLLNERLNLTFDVYRNETSKMLINEPVAAATGMINALTNTGGMKTTGVELGINARAVNTPVFKWDIGLNLSKYTTTVSKLPVDKLVTSFGGASMIAQTGSAPNLYYGYQTEGIYSTDEEAAKLGYAVKAPNGNLLPFKGGDVRFADMNNDKIIDAKDRVVIGNPNPDFYGSFSNHVQWKKWSLDALFTFSQGNDLYNFVRNQLESVSTYNNQTPAVRNSWKKSGDITSVPKITWADPMGNSSFSDRWIEDGSYLRLRTVSISYNVPVKSEYIKYGVVYLTGNNVFTLTKYLGYDPEFSATQGVWGQGVDIALEPLYKSVQLGVRIGL